MPLRTTFFVVVGEEMNKSRRMARLVAVNGLVFCGSTHERPHTLASSHNVHGAPICHIAVEWDRAMELMDEFTRSCCCCAGLLCRGVTIEFVKDGTIPTTPK